jgi:hypothetical protein
MTDPAEHPPQTRSNRTTLIVVGDNRCAAVDTEPPKGHGECFGRRQRVAAFFRMCGTCEIFVQMGIDRAGNVTEPPCSPACVGLEQVESAVDDDETVSAEPRLQLGEID